MPHTHPMKEEMKAGLLIKSPQTHQQVNTHTAEARGQQMIQASTGVKTEEDPAGLVARAALSLLWNTVRLLVRKPDTYPPWDPTVLLVGIHPGEKTTYVHVMPCTWVFMVASLIKARKCYRPQSLPTGEQVSRVWYVSNVQKEGGKTHWSLLRYRWVSITFF